MITTYTCQRCSQFPPPPPIFSVGPPPNILSINIHCSSRLLLSSSIHHKKVTSSSSSFVPATLGIVIALLISTGTIFLIKNQMIKRRQRKYDDSSFSVKFNGHNHHHHHQNWTKSIPLLSDSCSSNQTLSTPASEYPCGMIDSFLPTDLQHEYEQIKYDHSSHYYCLIYCRQCANYHQTSPPSCTCHLRNDNHLFELQPMLKTDHDDLNP